jgi:polyisoprenoid-binding protein YceI
MKQTYFTYFLATILAFSAVVSCKNEPKTTTTNTDQTRRDTILMGPTPSLEGARTYTITEGVVNWTGSSADKTTHIGTFPAQEGELKVNEGQLLQGKVTIDVKNLSVTDLKDAEKKKLEDHLRSKDFLEVAKFPTGTFTIGEVLRTKQEGANAVIIGQLTLKGISYPVNIPVNMTISDTELVAQSSTFAINRTKWGIKYQSGIIGTVKDKIISDLVILQLNIKAVAK